MAAVAARTARGCARRDAMGRDLLSGSGLECLGQKPLCLGRVRLRRHHVQHYSHVLGLLARNQVHDDPRARSMLRCLGRADACDFRSGRAGGVLEVAMQPDQTDPVIGLAKALTLLIGASAAEWVAPQLGVFLAGVAGGGIGVMGWRKCTRTEAMAYATASGLGGWLFASMLAGLSVALWPALAGVNNLPHGGALVIGGVGHRWPAVARWVGLKIRTVVDATFARGPKP
jgi:hypothetical protein